MLGRAATFIPRNIRAAIAAGGVLATICVTLLIGLFKTRYNYRQLFAKAVSQNRMDWINKWRENLSVFLTAAKVLHDTTINSGERDKLMFELIKARTMVTSRLNMQEDMHVLMFGAMKRFDLNASFNDAQYEYIDIETTDKNDVRIITYCVIGSVYNIPAGTYEYRYDIITGELLSVMEFSGSSVKQQYAKTTDDFGRTGGVRFTLDNGKTMGYTYSYKSDFEDTVSSIKLPNGKTAAFTFDDFGRLKTRSVNTSSALQNEYTYCNNRTDSGSTTPLVSKESLIVGNLPNDYSYTYDSNNNILTIKNGSSALLVSYEYDGLNRLIRENIVGGNTTVFKYDKGGNLQYKKVYSYSAAAGKTYTDLLNGTGKTISYGYGVSSNKDLLTSYNGSGTLEYDNYGNPQKWFKHGANGSTLGYTLQWGSDDRLVMVEDVAARDIYTYIYNDQGIRTVKFVNDVMHTYYLQGEQIIAEMYGNNFLKFYYDSTGICGFNYNGTDYYYQKNIQGDILKIFDGNGTLYAEHGYDAWGKCTIKTNVNGIAKINPFRYRGYYLDDETGLYYLNSRYYDPEIGRFISPDSTEYLSPETINGLNLYAYCDNNPVVNVDPSGHIVLSTIFIALTVGAIMGGIFSAIKAADAGLDVRGIILSAIGGAIMGAAVSVSFALGGAAATGLTVGVNTLNISGLTFFAVSAFGTAAASVANYALQSEAYNNLTSLNGYIVSAFDGFVEGMFSFGLGAIAGTNGLFRNIRKSIFKKSKMVETVSRALIFSLPSAIARKTFRDNLQNNWGVYW